MQTKLYKEHFFPEETREIRQKVRAFAEKEVFPLARDIGEKRERNRNFPRRLFRKMAAEGLFRIPFSKEAGGLGLSYPACGAAVMAEELAYISASVAGTAGSAGHVRSGLRVFRAAAVHPGGRPAAGRLPTAG